MKLTEQQFEMLVSVVTEGPISVADLAGSVYRTEAATRSAIRRLAARGLVSMTMVDGGHTRTPRWFATDEGEALAEAETI
jgi:DNA-binding MarR family transcriptional regulator